MPRQSSHPATPVAEPTYIISEQLPAHKVLQALKWRHLDINSYQTLMKYREHQDASGSCQLDVAYRQSDCGRLVVSHGIQLLQQKVRSILLSDTMWEDMDIENCHPNFLLQLAKEHNLQCDLLESYCRNTKDMRMALPGLKRDVLVAINDPMVASTQPLLAQCKQIVKLLFAEPKYLQYHPSEGENVVGRFISKLLCHKECELLVSIYKEFDAKDVLALIHDGLVVRRSAENNYKIAEINQRIAPMRLIPKPWADVPQNEFYNLQSFDYDNHVYFNELTRYTDRHFSSENQWLFTVRPIVLESVRMIGARDVILKEGDKEYKVLANLKVEGLSFKVENEKGKLVGKTFKQMITHFAPLISFNNYTLYRSTKTTEFSLFCGFAARGTLPQEAKQVITPIINHIREVWASDNEEMFNYILKWFAFIVQRFPEKTGKNIILNGDEGTGKSMVMDWFKESVFGHSLCYTTSGSEMLTRGFNSHLAGKLLVCLEELKGDNDNQWKHAIDVIKHLTTSKKMNIERKGVDVKEDINAMNIIAFTNYEHALPNVPGMNRRLVLNRVSDKYKGNHAYFQRLNRALSDRWSGLAMLEFLRSIPTSYEELEKIPQTVKKVEMRWHYLTWNEKLPYLMIAQDRINKTPQDSYEFTTRMAMDVINAHNIYVSGAKTTMNTAISIGQMLGKRFTKRKTGQNITKFSFESSQFADQDMIQSAIEQIQASSEVYDECLAE